MASDSPAGRSVMLNLNLWIIGDGLGLKWVLSISTISSKVFSIGVRGCTKLYNNWYVNGPQMVVKSNVSCLDQQCRWHRNRNEDVHSMMFTTLRLS